MSPLSLPIKFSATSATPEMRLIEKIRLRDSFGLEKMEA
jgi:hypothetical protein